MLSELFWIKKYRLNVLKLKALTDPLCLVVFPMNTLDNFVKKMSTSQARANTKKD